MSDDFSDYLCSIRTTRTWWKPWTWRRKQMLDVWHLGGFARAVNPSLNEPQGREIEMPPVIFEPDEPIAWDSEEEQS